MSWSSVVLVVYIVVTYYQCDLLDLKKTLLNPFKRNKADKLGDLKKCRVTHSGVEYEGNIAETKSGILCQNWETPDPIHKVAEQIVDVDFPEGSKKKAKNFCRNPRYWSGKPWCYTLDFNITDEQCDVPLCMKTECRLTGPGVEYSGLVHFFKTKDCLYWSDIRGTEYKAILYDSLFPDGTRKKAENRCRNPDSDPGGPWCFVDAHLTEDKTNLKYEKVYCGIPMCEPKPCMTATTAVSSGYEDYHTVFSLLPPNTTSIDFSVKLWHPDQWQSGVLKLALSSIPLPSTGSTMRLTRTGIEIVISTYKSGLTPNGPEEPDWNVEAGLLSGTHWQDLELSWAGGFISLKIKGKSMAVFNKDYTGHEKDLSRGQFRFYSIKGSNAIWNFPYCLSEYPYEEHVTSHGDFERRWPLPKSSMGYELKFSVRGFHTAIVELKVAAMLQYPSVQLTLVNVKNANLTTLTIKESAQVDRLTLKEVRVDSLLSYWEWKEFSLTVDGPQLELNVIAGSRTGKLLSVIDHRFESLKWFSIGSRQSTVHWTLSSSPPLEKHKIPAELPECVMSESEVDFSGSQSVSASGLTCAPWSDPSGTVPQNIDDSKFVDGSRDDAKNYCRNPTRDAKGPFCYAVDLLDSGYTTSKQYCSPRQCRSKECKMAGTGNDYIGSLSVTLSGRTCQRWTSKTPHSVPQKFLNKEMFPELSISNVSNLCRNPSHDIAGLWCYTTELSVDTDRCDVPDCDGLGACTVFVKGNITRQSVYILPLWKSNGLAFKVKSWDPKWVEGVRFIIKLSNESSQYRLDIGAGSNDKIILYLIDDKGKERLLKQKTVSHIIPSGSWAGFVLVLGVGEVSIKYENIPTAFFRWKHTYSEGEVAYIPRFLSYSALSNSHVVGLHFPCDECHTHSTQPGLTQNIYPLNWWKPQQQHVPYNVLSLNIRGSGTFIVVLMRLVDNISNRLLIEVSDNGYVVIKDQESVLDKVRRKDYKIFNNRLWTNLTLLFNEKNLTLAVGDISLIEYLSVKPLVFYFFTVSVSDGLLLWSANCDAVDINALPINGGWSNWGSWQCSATCGGGHGKRRRLCNRPKPNLFGEPCNGSEVMEGPCNNFKCGDVPPTLYQEMVTYNSRQAHNIRKKVGESLLVQCHTYILTELKDVSPNTKVEWTKDGEPLFPQQKAGSITADIFTVRRESVGLNDSGIYICSLEDRKGKKAVIQLTAVTIVVDSFTKFSRLENTMILDCLATPLTYLFSELTQFWTLNGKLYHDYGATSHSLMDIDVLHPVSQSHEGEWECVVVQVRHNLTWVTSWFRLQVKSNSVVAIMFDKIPFGHYFRPFGDSVVLNSILFFFLLLLVVFGITVSAFFTYTKVKNTYYSDRYSVTKEINVTRRRTLSRLRQQALYDRLGIAEYND